VLFRSSGDSIDNGTTSSTYVHSNSSRLGFKGSHDLGDGMTVLYQYESGVDLTGNGTGDGNGGCGGTPNTCEGQVFTRTRDSFIGLKGGFGTALFGRLPAHNQWLYDYNLFGDQVGDLGNIFGHDLPGRANSAIYYGLPALGDLAVGLSYVPEQGGTNGGSYIAKADYASKGLKVGAAFASFAGANDHKVTAITGSYDFGQFNVGGAWQSETDAAGVAGDDVTKYTVGAGFKVSDKVSIKAQYAHADDYDSTPNSGASQVAVGIDYALDKHTTLYAAYSSTDNDAATGGYSAYNWGHGDQGVPAIAGSPKAFSVGVVYKFDAQVK
jgi:predicted porin